MVIIDIRRSVEIRVHEIFAGIYMTRLTCECEPHSKRYNCTCVQGGKGPFGPAAVTISSSGAGCDVRGGVSIISLHPDCKNRSPLT